mgnify:CR=1 FL=1
MLHKEVIADEIIFASSVTRHNISGDFHYKSNIAAPLVLTPKS